jgi:hypothetical protein
VGGVKYLFHATETSWENFYRLPDAQKDSVRRVWRILKENPFDPRSRTHRIHRLSAFMRCPVHPVVIECDLQAVFYIKGEVVVSFNIGTHDIYKG